MMNLSNKSQTKIVEPFDAQCTLCTILIGGVTTTFRKESGKVETLPRVEQDVHQWKGHTVCGDCLKQIARYGDDKYIKRADENGGWYYTTLLDEMLYNIKKNMQPAVSQQTSMEIAV
jgi:hypothetical protein